MKKSIKTTSIILSLLICVGVLTSCETPNKKETEITTIKISYFLGGYRSDWIDQLGKKFEQQNPGVKVVSKGDTDLTKKVQMRLETSSDLSDIYFTINRAGIWASKGYLEPLDDVYTSKVDKGSDKTIKDKLPIDLAESYQLKGSMYAIPWAAGTAGIVYNQVIFDKLKLTVPKTVDELIEVCEQIKNSDVNNNASPDDDVRPIIWNGKINGYWDFPVYTWWAQYEGIENFKEFWKFKSPEVFAQKGRLEALKVFEKLIKNSPDNVLKGSESYSHIEMQILFAQGKAAMMPNGSWTEKESAGSLTDKVIMRMMPTPLITGAKTQNTKPVQINNSWSGMDSIFIPKAAKNKDLAKKFLRFLHEDENLVLFTKLTGSPRPFKYTISDADMASLSPLSKDAFKLWSESENIYYASPDPKFIVGAIAGPWPTGLDPYASIVMQNMSADDVFNREAKFAKDTWATWTKMANK